MDTRTGKIINHDDLMEAFSTGEIPEQEQKFYVPVKRDTTLRERLDMQIRIYSPCGCGSGKKFKFCCKTKK